MGVYTFADFKLYLKERFGNHGEWDAYFGIWINSAYRSLCTKDKIWEVKHRLFIPELEAVTTAISTVDGQGYVVQPTDVMSVREIADLTSKKTLDWISWAEYVGKTDRHDTTAEGSPTRWHRRGGNIYLYKTPDAIYGLEIFYKKRVADLTGVQVTVIGQEWDDTILELGHYFGRMWSGEYDKAKTSQEAASKQIIDILTTYQQEEMARRESIRPNPQMRMPGY